jgi:hypothetical protein
MTRRIAIVVTVLFALAALGASRRTANFVVQAPTQEIADRVAAEAERQRKDQALAWLGRELPPWKEPCPVRVEVTLDRATGATTFCFAPKGGVLWQKMEVKGPLDRLLTSVLPHEVTHTVFAHHLGRPVPRWADEGGAITTEDAQECDRQVQVVQKAVKACRLLPLRRLFAREDYPSDLGAVCTFYGQSYSVSRFLIEAGGRSKFLDFVKRGYQDGWDEAAREVYGYPDVEALERAWLASVRQH